MANFPTGTVRLGPDDWVDEGGWGNDSEGWLLQPLDTAIGDGELIDLATSTNPRGWTVTPISGEFGDSDLVVDITPPATLKSASVYDITIEFRHGHYENDTGYSQVYTLSTTALKKANTPRRAVWYDVTPHRFISAVLEPTGLQLYGYSNDFDEKEELAFIQYGRYPSLWRDENGYLYLSCLVIDDPLADTAPLRLYRSQDDGRTLEAVEAEGLTIPAQPYYQGLLFIIQHAPLMGYLDKGIVVAMGAKTGDIVQRQISYNNGATWGEMENFRAGVMTTPQHIGVLPDTRTPIAQSGGGILTSPDFGKTWQVAGTNIPAAHGGALGLGNAELRMGVTLAGDFYYRYGKTGSATQGARIDEINDDSILTPFQAKDGSIYATNGRDRLYRSTDMGTTWSTL